MGKDGEVGVKTWREVPEIDVTKRKSKRLYETITEVSGKSLYNT